jgi:PleD family two-component response regulator
MGTVCSIASAQDIRNAQVGCPQKIYLVDDDPAVRDSLARFLENEGYNVTQLIVARALLNAVNDEDSAVIVLDRYLMTCPVLNSRLSSLSLESIGQSSSCRAEVT